MSMNGSNLVSELTKNLSLSTQLTFNDGMNLSTSGDKKNDPNNDVLNGITEVVNDRQSLSIDILVSGFVNSYVDFFYLTHRNNDSTTKIPVSQLDFVKGNLSQAERAHRRGDSEQVFDNYEKLADYFQSIVDFKTAVYFYEKCLDIAESMDDLAQQCNSNLHLGLAHDAMGKTAMACKFHERHLHLANEMDDVNRLKMANRQLVNIYQKCAEEYEKKGGNENIAQSIFYLKKCSQAASDCDDLLCEGIATYKLGIACSKLGDLQQSIDFQRRYLEICKELGNQQGEGEACHALAENFKLMGEIKLAERYLIRYLDVATRNKMLIAQAHACGALGQIYSEMKDHNKSVNYLERTFEIAKTVGDRKLVDTARVNLGMARGHMTLDPYMNIIQTDLSKLLRWKQKRIDLVRSG